MSNLNSIASPLLVQSHILANHFAALARTADGCGWTFAAWSFRAKAEAHLKAHEARLFCAAAQRALIAFDVPFVSSARDNVRPEQIVRL